jgi:D-glycero-alpha-D-manno-heptose-7-phosphate kinase
VRELPPFFKHKIRVAYSRIETVTSFEQIQHPAVREALRLYAPERGLEIQHHGDLPAQSGVGSSSSFAVGLLNSIFLLNGTELTKSDLALLAIEFEQKHLAENVGSQDQIACAYGGFNIINFDPSGAWSVKSPFEISVQDCVNDYLYPVFTGITRFSSDIQSQLIENLNLKEKLMLENIELVDLASEILRSKKDINSIGELMNVSWEIKRELNPLSVNSEIEEFRSAGLAAGATGVKVLGAGGGGFLLFWVSPENRERFRAQFRLGTHVPVKISHGGSKIIHSAS